MGIALAVRLGLVLFYPHYWGVDGGASLLTVNAVLGDEPTGAGFPKPPFAPGLLLAPFVILVGPDTGYKVWSAVFSIFPLIPIYLLTRQISKHWLLPLVATAFGCIDWMLGEMFAAGSQPMLAFMMLGLALWSMGELQRRFSWPHAVGLSLCVGLIPWTNQTTAGLALVLLPAYTLTLLIVSADRRILFYRITPFALLGGLIALGSLPWYMQTLPGSGILRHQGDLLLWAWGINTLQSFAIAFPLGFFLVWKAPSPHIKALAVTLIVMGVMVNFLSYDEVLINPLYRARYFMAVIAYPLIAWTCWRYWVPRIHPKLAVALTAVAFVYFSAMHFYGIRLQSQYSLMITRDTAQILDARRGDSTGIGTNVFSMSLWVSALNKVNSPFLFTSGPPPSYLQMDKDMRCLLNWVEVCNPAQAAQRLDIGYLLIDERFPYYNQYAPGNWKAPPDQWRRTAEAPWLTLAEAKGTTRLWEITADD